MYNIQHTTQKDTNRKREIVRLVRKINIHTLRFLKSPKFVPFEVEAVCNFSKGKGADLLEIHTSTLGNYEAVHHSKIHLLATNGRIIRLLNANKSNKYSRCNLLPFTTTIQPF